MSTISQTRAICFSKIDFQKKQLLIDCQLGRGYDNEGFDDNTLLSQKRTLKLLTVKDTSRFLILLWMSCIWQKHDMKKH